MNSVAHLVKVTLPDYFAGLPVPDSIGGWFHLGVKEWISLIPPTAAFAGLVYTTYKAFCPKARTPCGAINHSVKKDVAKVVDSVDIEDITEKAVFCRCWRTKNWPYCDGSHSAHNIENADNTGPLIITAKNK